MRRETLAAGLGMLETALRLKPTKAEAAVFWAILADLDDDAFEAAVRDYLRRTTKRPERFPLPGEIAALAGDGGLDLEADAAWQRVLDHGFEYTPESGTVWKASRVRELVGEAAHRAVIAAGGYEQLAVLGTERDRFFARKRFVEAYAEQRANGLPALPPAPDPGPRALLPERSS